MKVFISESLNRAFFSAHKNLNYSLDFLLSSVDLDICAECLKLIEQFKLSGGCVEVEIDEGNLKAIRKIFGSTKSSIIEQLLWVSILFPEI